MLDRKGGCWHGGHLARPGRDIKWQSRWQARPDTSLHKVSPLEKTSDRLILFKNWLISSRKKVRFLLFSKSVSRQFFVCWPKQNQGKFWSEQNLICQQWMREWWVSVFINTTHFTIKHHCSAAHTNGKGSLIVRLWALDLFQKIHSKWDPFCDLIWRGGRGQRRKCCH